MHMEYRVSLPDHNKPVGWQQPNTNSLLSVYAGSKIQPEGIGNQYSLPTYIAARSDNYASTTAYANVFVFDRLLGPS